MIADSYNRKRNHYSEGTIYPFLQLSDFNSELFTRARNLIRGNNQNHPWLPLSDEQLLQKAGLWKKDYASGQEGYTLAAVLLFGKDETIQQILPHYKTDALVDRAAKVSHLGRMKVSIANQLLKIDSIEV